MSDSEAFLGVLKDIFGPKLYRQVDDFKHYMESIILSPDVESLAPAISSVLELPTVKRQRSVLKSIIFQKSIQKEKMKEQAGIRAFLKEKIEKENDCLKEVESRTLVQEIIMRKSAEPYRENIEGLEYTKEKKQEANMKDTAKALWVRRYRYLDKQPQTLTRLLEHVKNNINVYAQDILGRRIPERHHDLFISVIRAVIHMEKNRRSSPENASVFTACTSTPLFDRMRTRQSLAEKMSYEIKNSEEAQVFNDCKILLDRIGIPTTEQEVFSVIAKVNIRVQSLIKQTNNHRHPALNQHARDLDDTFLHKKKVFF